MHGLSAWSLLPQVVALDSLKKRCTFIDSAVEKLGLQNVTTKWSRAEDAGQDPLIREVGSCWQSPSTSCLAFIRSARFLLSLISVSGCTDIQRGSSTSSCGATDTGRIVPAVRGGGGHLGCCQRCLKTGGVCRPHLFTKEFALVG
jgi:rRNA small subunit methyltransferase G